MVNQERNIAVCIILTIVTCGIYGIYWMIVLNDEVLQALQEEGTGGGLVFLFTLLTCGIYGIYWCYQMGQRIDRLNSRYGRYTDNSGLLYIILDIVGLSVVAYAVMQNELNKYYRENPMY